MIDIRRILCPVDFSGALRAALDHAAALARSSQMTAAAVKNSLEQALERQAGREAMRIGVAVRDDEVTLSGTVHSWAAKQPALGAARGIAGIRNVRDQLRIEP